MSGQLAYAWAPEYEHTDGAIAAEVAERLGKPFDAVQRQVADAVYAETSPGVPACFEVVEVAPRQNFKSHVYEVCAITDVFVMGDRLHTWTAHIYDTAEASFARIRDMIEGCDDFRRACKKPREGKGDLAIQLLDGAEIQFETRGGSGKGGRGETGSKVTFDEALYVQALSIGALLPTLATRPEAQVRYASSAGLPGSAFLRLLRDRGRPGNDPRLAYFEACAPRTACADEACTHLPIGRPGCALDNRDLWRAANTAYNVRITEDRLADFRRAMPPAEFMREFLGWWEDPDDGLEARIPTAAFADCKDVTSKITGPPMFSVDVTPNGTRASIGVAGATAEGRVHGELVQNAPGTQWLVDRIDAVTRKAGSRTVVLDPRAASFLVPDLEAKGITVRQVNGTDVGQACATLANLVATRRFVHLDQFELTVALASAATRDIGDAGWAYARKNSAGDISPLYAVTLAVYGHVTAGATPSVYEARGLNVL